MEMLIVVAIIAVLVAIAIPVFMGQLANSRAQADAANIRSGYASVMAQILTDNQSESTWYGLQSDGSVKEKTAPTFTPQGQASDLSNSSETIGGQKAYSTTASDNAVNWDTSSKICYSWNGDTLTIKTTQPTN